MFIWRQIYKKIHKSPHRFPFYLSLCLAYAVCRPPKRSGQRMTRVALFVDILQRARQSIGHVVVGLHRVVKDYDVARTDVTRHLAQTLLGRHLPRIVLTDYGPQHHLVMFQHLHHLFQSHSSVGRTVEIGLEYAVGALDVGHVLLAAHLPTFEVVGGVVAEPMSRGGDFLYEMGVELGVFAQTEECGFGIVLGQRVENELGDAGRGSVVEGEVDLLAVAVYLPDDVRHEYPEQFGYFDKHSL